MLRMVALVKSKIVPDRGSSMFLFSDATTLRNAPDALSLTWTSGKGEPVRLTDRS
jgi:hypothetical protein